MNGIVSFDDGDGTVIEGDGITTGIINCTTLNATSTVNSATVNTDFIGKKANAEITVLNDTKFNNNIYVSNLYPLPGIGTEITFNGIMRAASTIYTDFIAPNANTYISVSGNTKFNNDIYVNNLWPYSGVEMYVKSSLICSNTVRSEAIESKGGVGSKILKIGQDNDNTTSVYIGRKEQIVLGTTYPAIPPRTTFYAVGDDDIANKKYVDSVTAGTNILSLTNIFTGTSNTFNNFIKTSQIDSVTPSSTYNFLTSHTSTLNIGTASSAITLGSSTAPTRTDYVPLIDADICNKLYTDTKVNSSVSGLLASTNIWTSASNTFNNAIRCAIAPSAATDLCNKTYVDSVAGSLLLTATNIWTGASNTFNNVVKFGPSTGSQISIYPTTIESTTSNGIIGLFNNITTGTLEIGKLIGSSTGSITFINNFRMTVISGVLHFRSFTTGDNVAFCSNLTNGNISIGEGQTIGDINIGAGAARTLNGVINIGNGAGTNQNPINIGGAGKVSIGTKVYVGETLANINYNLGGGGAAQTITIPSTGVFMYVFGANWGDGNITATTFVSAGTNNCRLFNQYLPPGLSYSLT
jgi:hypothetical protein